MERRLAAVLAADLAGFSRLMGADETGTLVRVKACFEEIVEPAVAEHRGRVVKYMGDGCIAEFTSVVQAVECAVEIQQEMDAHNQRAPDLEPLKFRIGLNLGDIIVDGEDLFGDGVNVASRIEALADPGGILISRSVRDQIRDKLKYELEDRGEISVKNIVRPVRLFQVGLPGQTQSARPVGQFAAMASSRRTIAAVLGVIILAVSVGGTYYVYRALTTAPARTETSNETLAKSPSIAVLPFANRSEDDGQQYFADGLTDDLITDLSKISGLSVIARNSVFSYKDKPTNILDIAKELGVHYLLEGSIRRSGSQVRVNAQLVDGKSGRQIWSERYDRELVDIFSVQDQLVASIVSELAVRLEGGEATKAAGSPPKFEAYDLYLRAREGFYSRNPQRMRASLELFRRAWTADPSFARAYSGYAQLAQDIGRLGSLRFALGGGPAIRSAEVAARKALEIDPKLADAYSVLALIRMVDNNHDQAQDLARRAVAFEPSNADALTTLAIVQLYGGDKDAALQSIKMAARLNPIPQPYFEIYRGLVYFFNNLIEDAAKALEPIADANVRSLGDAPREILAMVYSAMGRKGAARAQVKSLRDSEPFLNIAYYRVLYSHHANRSDLERRLDALRVAGMPDWPFGFAGKESDKLTTDEIQNLIRSRRWVGEDVGRRSSFVKEFGSHREVSYAASRMILNGSASTEDDWLCERYDGFILGRKLCGPLYRDQPQSGPGSFTYVNPATIVHFRVETP